MCLRARHALFTFSNQNSSVMVQCRSWNYSLRFGFFFKVHKSTLELGHVYREGCAETRSSPVLELMGLHNTVMLALLLAVNRNDTAAVAHVPCSMQSEKSINFCQHHSPPCCHGDKRTDWVTLVHLETRIKSQYLHCVEYVKVSRAIIWFYTICPDLPKTDGWLWSTKTGKVQ